MVISSEDNIGEAYRDQIVAKEYVERRFDSELNRLLHDRQVRAVRSILDAARPRRSLEIAPGPGRITRDLDPPDELVCLELNDGMIAEGRKACRESVQWVQGSAFELPFAQEFDFVYTFRFLRHFHREDRERLYTQIRKVLRPNGSLVIDAVNEQVSEPLRRANPEDYPIYDKLYRTEQELRTELAGAGFEVLQLEPVQRWFPLQYRAQVLLGPRSRWLCRLAIQTLERLRRGPALEWIVTCRRA
ncbi:MAG: class I SAM-dependent methyltransferase [Pirellulaceae bacterium]